jgi:glutamyl-tRNA(Gln) amidotransferase subunit D
MVETNDQITYGILIPRYEYSNQEHIVVKLSSGYNIGIKLSRIKKIQKMISPNFDKKIEKSNSILKKSGIFHINTTESSELMNNKVKSLPIVSLLSTGGTISSRIDYRTGAVSPALSAQDLYDSVPVIQNIAIIEPDILFSEYSENLGPRHWTMIAERVTDQILSGKYNGIIISHGTDTMHYTVPAKFFPRIHPLIIVGSDRPDRPSSDAF